MSCSRAWVAVLGLVSAVSASAAPLGGNVNLQFYSPGANGNVCQPIDNLTVTIDVSQDIVSNDGFAFQLNGAASPGSYQGWQQYMFSLTSSPTCIGCETPMVYTLAATTEPWPTPKGDPGVAGNIANTISDQRPKFAAPIIPKGYRFVIALQTNREHKVTSVHYQAFAPPGHAVAMIDQTMVIADLKPAGGQGGATLGPTTLSTLNVFNLVLVGPTNGFRAHLSSGAGTITYTTAPTTPLRSRTKVPAKCADTGNSTAENSNSTYTDEAKELGSSFTQQFSIAEEPPYTPGGLLAAIAGTDHHNRVFVADVAAQVVELQATSAGEFSVGSAAVASFLMDGKNDLIASRASGVAPTLVLGGDQDGGAVAYQFEESSGWGSAASISPHHNLRRFGNRAAVAQRSGVVGETDFFAIDGKTGQITVTRGNGSWGSAKSITNANTFNKNAALAASDRFGTSEETDVFAINPNGRLVVASAKGGAAWSQQLVSGKHVFAAGGSLAVTRDAISSDQTDVFSIDGDGDLVELTSKAGAAWSAVNKVEAVGNLVHGGRLVAWPDTAKPGQLDVFTFDTAGALEVLVASPRGSWSASKPLAGATAPAGAALAAIQDSSVPTQTDVFYIDGKGQPSMVWEDHGGWHGPTALTKPCVPGYTKGRNGACYRDCTATGTVASDAGTCECVAGTTRGADGSCSTCPHDSIRNIDGVCTPLCNATHTVATAGACGCAPGYTLNAAGICAACASGFSAVASSCVAPADVPIAACTASGGEWDADAADCAREKHPADDNRE